MIGLVLSELLYGDAYLSDIEFSSKVTAASDLGQYGAEKGLIY